MLIPCYIIIVVEIGFQTSIMNVSEESGSFSVDISKTGSNERPVSVRIFTESASAIGQSYIAHL